jgi:hypothetical protein
LSKINSYKAQRQLKSLVVLLISLQLVETEECGIAEHDRREDASFSVWLKAALFNA